MAKESRYLIIYKRAWGNKGKVYVSFRCDKAGFRASYSWFLN